MSNSSQEHYESFVKTHPQGSFFQSFHFGEFQEKIPYRGKSWALMVKNASCLVIKQKLPLNYCWLWVPYGPLGFDEKKFEDLKRIAKEEKALFARIEPPNAWDEKHTNELKKHWNIKYTHERYTPEYSLVLNIDCDEKEVLAKMKPKGRYNINVAKKHGVKVKMWEGDENEFDKFYEILKKTGQRDEFGIHPKSFYEKLLKTLPKEMVSLFLAYAGGTVVAGIIVVFYKDTATYYYGASSSARKNLMAPYLLQWEAILEAKKRRMKFYDFLGISPPDAKDHPWKGITEFKKKFGGKEVKYPRTFNIIYKPFLYKLYRFLKHLKKF